MQVEWEGMTEPSAADAVALVMPPDADLGTTVPLKYKWATKSPEHEASGGGHLRCVPAALYCRRVLLCQHRQVSDHVRGYTPGLGASLPCVIAQNLRLPGLMLLVCSRKLVP